MVAESMEVDDYVHNVIAKLDSKDINQVLKTIIEIKNLIIGNNKYKSIYIHDDIMNKLIDLININKTQNLELINEIIIIFGSFSKGTQSHINKLLTQYKLNDKLIDILVNIDLNKQFNDYLKIIETCIRCLKNLYYSTQLMIASDASTFIVDDDDDDADDVENNDDQESKSLSINYNSLFNSNTIKCMFKIFQQTNQLCKQYIIEIFANTCIKYEYQKLLVDNGAIPIFAPLLTSNIQSIQLASLKLFTALCYNNVDSSKIMLGTLLHDNNLCDTISTYLSRDRSIEIQLYAAKCITNLCRCECINYKNQIIKMRTLPTLVRLCQRTMPLNILLNSVPTLTYLIELNAELQETASYLEQIVPTLAYYVIYHTNNQTKSSLNNTNCLMAAGNAANQRKSILKNRINIIDSSIIIANNNNYDLKQTLLSNATLSSTSQTVNSCLAAYSFHALAALASNNEDVRRRISDQDGLMNRLVESLQQSNDKQLRLGALSLLHSLSRSVQQLRTKFLDHKIWTPIIDLIQNDDEQLICKTTAIISNLLLEFSPSKEVCDDETMIEYGVINILSKLIDHKNTSVKINAMWALMNMAFQAEQKVKQQILSTITMEKLFQLLTEQDEHLIMKTLGLLRNLISNKSHIDQIMSTYGNKVIQAIIMILEGDYNTDIKEQALCILSNVADGNTAKQYIMGNEDLLRKITSFMNQQNTQLQIAAVFCISNLVWNSDEGASERQAKLREIGVQRALQKLLHSSDPILFDKVKNSLQQFSSINN